MKNHLKLLYAILFLQSHISDIFKAMDRLGIFSQKHFIKKKQTDNRACSMHHGCELEAAMKRIIVRFSWMNRCFFNYKSVNWWRLNPSNESNINTCVIAHSTYEYNYSSKQHLVTSKERQTVNVVYCITLYSHYIQKILHFPILFQYYCLP